MKRREFLGWSYRVGGALLIAPAVVSTGSIACSDNESGSGGSASRTFTVDMANGHTHDFSIPNSVLSSPPALGYVATTTSDSGHTHTVSMSQQDLLDIEDGTGASGSTSFNSAHLHGWSA